MVVHHGHGLAEGVDVVEEELEGVQVVLVCKEKLQYTPQLFSNLASPSTVPLRSMDQ